MSYNYTGTATGFISADTDITYNNLSITASLVVSQMALLQCSRKTRSLNGEKRTTLQDVFTSSRWSIPYLDNSVIMQSFSEK